MVRSKKFQHVFEGAGVLGPGVVPVMVNSVPMGHVSWLVVVAVVLSLWPGPFCGLELVVGPRSVASGRR
jgi:hypothetical protein